MPVSEALGEDEPEKPGEENEPKESSKVNESEKPGEENEPKESSKVNESEKPGEAEAEKPDSNSSNNSGKYINSISKLFLGLILFLFE